MSLLHVLAWYGTLVRLGRTFNQRTKVSTAPYFLLKIGAYRTAMLCVWFTIIVPHFGKTQSQFTQFDQQKVYLCENLLMFKFFFVVNSNSVIQVQKNHFFESDKTIKFI